MTTEAPESYENNWIQTVTGKGFNIAFKLYGPYEAWLRKNEDPELVN